MKRAGLWKVDMHFAAWSSVPAHRDNVYIACNDITGAIAKALEVYPRALVKAVTDLGEVHFVGAPPEEK